MDDESKLLTVREVAHSVGRSEETVRRWIWSGKLSARKIGNQHFVSPADLAELTAPRLGERRAAYRTPRVADDPPLSKNHWPYDREQKLREFEEDIEFAQRMYKKYGPVDVTELIRQVREEGDDD